MTTYATTANVRTYGVGLTLPDDATLTPALERANRWATRQVGSTILTADQALDVRDAVCAYTLGILVGNGVSVADSAPESVHLGTLKMEFGGSAPVRDADGWLSAARAHLDDAGLTTTSTSGLSIVTRHARGW